MEGKVRIQLNLKVEQAKHINSVKNFRDIVFPIVWVEEVSVTKHKSHQSFNHFLSIHSCESIQGLNGFVTALILSNE